MVQLDLQSRQPIYEQLIFKMSELISLGALKPDEQLPSVRALARDLGVNPNTVQKAYQELERNSIIYSVAGKGSFIASGNSANEVLRRQNIAKIREALHEGKRTGLTRPQVNEVVESVYSVYSVYKEETAHD
ncbi:GntR family transcriptional regulator [Oscillospiraceae bacterium PP1C4]